MSDQKYKVAIFASGSGTNAEQIFKYFQHHPSIRIVMLLSNNPNAYALERARKFNVPGRIFNKQEWRESTVVLQWLAEAGVTHIVLAGFLWLVPAYLINAYSGKMINIHPALLPRYGGKGMYGEKVHQAVKLSGDAETGITIHLVNEQYDDGEILFQGRCQVDPTDTPEQIAQKVHALEYVHYPQVIEKWILKGDA